MLKRTVYQSCILRFSDEGRGTPIVLLHGYLESLEIWKSFATELARSFRVIAIDLPGHGQSLPPAEPSMEFMAGAVNHIVRLLKLEKPFVVGHSMGGYVALAYANEYPQMLSGFCLFHSSPLADTEEKKNNRQREISLVEEGKKATIISVNIPKAFATDNLETCHDDVEFARRVALRTSDAGIVTALQAMMKRREHTDVLNTDLPKLFILGRKDNYIDYHLMASVYADRPHSNLATLDHSGHMGFLEEKDQSLETISWFVSAM